MFGNQKTVKIDKDLYFRLKESAERGGYSSVQELITHALEREAARIDESSDDEQVEQQLRGLGYLE